MKKAVMYGAGSIGRGFIGQLFSLSGYEVVFLDISDSVIDRLNNDRSYPLRIVSAGGASETTVVNVRGVNSADTAAAAAEIATADVMATAVGANILPRIAPVIARGLEERWRSGNDVPLNIIICENLMDAHKALEKLLLAHIGEGFRPLFNQRVGLVEASIGRMVPVATEQMQQGNPLRVWAEPYSELPVDLEGFRGALPAIIGLKPFSPFGFYIERKLYMHNMSHAVLAYLGCLAGYGFIWQAVRDASIAEVARGALAEAAEAISKKHMVPIGELEVFSDDLMARFDNPMLGDTVERVGRDPIRKLAPGDRLTGAASLCLEQGVDPARICQGIAAGLLFSPSGDDAALRIRNSIAEDGLAAALTRYCGLTPDSPLYELIRTPYERYKAR